VHAAALADRAIRTFVIRLDNPPPFGRSPPARPALAVLAFGARRESATDAAQRPHAGSAPKQS